MTGWQLGISRRIKGPNRVGVLFIGRPRTQSEDCLMTLVAGILLLNEKVQGVLFLFTWLSILIHLFDMRLPKRHSRAPKKDCR